VAGVLAAGRQPTAWRAWVWHLGQCRFCTSCKKCLMSTARMHPVATQCGGAAALNGTKRFELLEVKARSIPVQEAIALSA